METTRTKLTPEQKIALLHQGYDAFNRGDVNTVLDLQAQDVVWHSRGSTRYGGDFKGKDGILGFLAQFPQDFEEFKLDVHDCLANGDHAVALLTSRFRRKGKTYEDKAVHVFHINDDGKTTEAWFALDTELVKEALER